MYRYTYVYIYIYTYIYIYIYILSGPGSFGSETSWARKLRARSFPAPKVSGPKLSGPGSFGSESSWVQKLLIRNLPGPDVFERTASRFGIEYGRVGETKHTTPSCVLSFVACPRHTGRCSTPMPTKSCSHIAELVTRTGVCDAQRVALTMAKVIAEGSIGLGKYIPCLDPLIHINCQIC